MFSTVYTYGHLLTGAFSLAMALAFCVIAEKVPGSRRDFGYAVIFTGTATVTAVELVQALEQTRFWAQSYIASVLLLHVVTTFVLCVMFAPGMSTTTQRRRARQLATGYAIAMAGMIAGLYTGVFEDGPVRHVRLFGAGSAILHAPAWSATACGAAMLGGQAIMAWILTRPGPRRGERMLLLVPVVASVVPTVYEQLLLGGAFEALPLGGHYTAGIGLIGAWVLADRVRSLSGETKQVGAYTIERRLGSGGMANVFLASRRGEGDLGKVVQRVALKRLRPEFVDDTQFVRMFLDEARLIARLEHPNIVALHEAGKAGGDLFLAMELVDGPALAQLQVDLTQRGERLPVDLAVGVAVEVGVQLADALAYAHALADEHGQPLHIVHRDVSPQNVLITRGGRVKLTDFGIARSAERSAHTQTGVVKGKVRYMAPEQIRSQDYDHRVDLYAVGAIMYELATGVVRFTGQSDVQILYHVLEGKLDVEDRLAALPAAFVDVLRQTVARDPAQRIASGEALLNALTPLRRELEAKAALARAAARLIDNPLADAANPFAETQIDTSGRRRADG